jgi:hypothetical protein
MTSNDLLTQEALSIQIAEYLEEFRVPDTVNGGWVPRISEASLIQSLGVGALCIPPVQSGDLWFIECFPPRVGVRISAQGETLLLALSRAAVKTIEWVKEQELV